MNDIVEAHHEFHLLKFREEWSDATYVKYIRALLAQQCSKLDVGAEVMEAVMPEAIYDASREIMSDLYPSLLDDNFWQAKGSTVLEHVRVQLSRRLGEDLAVTDPMLYASFQRISMEIARLMRDNKQLRIRSGVEPAWMSYAFWCIVGIVISVFLLVIQSC